MSVPYILYPPTFEFYEDKGYYLATTDAAFGEPDGNETYWGVSWLQWVKDKDDSNLEDLTMNWLRKCISKKFKDTDLKVIAAPPRKKLWV